MDRSHTSCSLDDYYLAKKLNIKTPCLICEEPVPLEHNGDWPKICEKCKKAVLLIRDNKFGCSTD